MFPSCSTGGVPNCNSRRPERLMPHPEIMSKDITAEIQREVATGVVWGKWGEDRESSKTRLKKDDTQHPPKERKVSQQDAYLAQVAALAEGSCRCPSSLLGSRSLFSSTLRPDHSRAVCVRGRDRWGGTRAPACGLGSGGDLGPVSLHLGHGKRATLRACLWREGRGVCPVLGWTLESILFPMDCTGGSGVPGNYPCSSGWNGRTPSIPRPQNQLQEKPRAQGEWGF